MKKTGILMVLILVLLTSLIHSKQIILKELMKPSAIYVGNERIYISEGTSIFIYSLKNDTLINKFGKHGEGPGEFKNAIGKIVLTNNKVIVNSVGSLSYYSKDGELIKSIKTGIIPPQFNFFPIKDKFVGIAMDMKRLNSYFCVSVFDKEFNRQKELLKVQQTKNGKVFVFSPLMALNSYFVYENNIYILGENNSEIDVLNYKGDKINSFKHGFKKIKVNKKEKLKFLELLNGHKSLNKIKIDISNSIVLPEYYPEISSLMISDKMIYVVGRKRRKNRELSIVLQIFDLKGKIIVENDINLDGLDKTERILMTFDNFTLYQLKENENEEWILHIKHL